MSNQIFSAETESREIFETVLDISFDNFLSWGKKFEPFVVLNSNSTVQLKQDNYSFADVLIAAGSINKMPAGVNLFDTLKSFHQKYEDWIFGYISYDIKNQVEKLSSANFDGIHAPEYFFFQPRYVLKIKGKNLKIYYDREHDNEESILKVINDICNAEPASLTQNRLNIQARVSREDYIERVNKIKKHIQLGDIYEMNYCVDFFSENATIDPVASFIIINDISPMPFSAYLNCGNIHLMCASPERFLAKRGKKIISQPIKGTAKRGNDKKEDDEIIQTLQNDPKERSENVMIVDLVRNDLSRTAARGSVAVEELFGIKTFRMLHQMISTITSEMSDGLHFTDVIRNAFPMGSMTGAPKIRAMKLIEDYECTKRGMYSGSIGYITPEGDFDFNVIIRSIIYNSERHYLTFMAGSAITDSSDSVKEYEECMLKAEGMMKALST